MDPLSIGSAVVGLISAAARITPLIWHLVNHSIDAPKTASQILAEMDSITSALERLQTFLMGASKTSVSRRSMLSIRNIVATLTACVTTYSDLEHIVGKCIGKSDGKVNRTKWIMYESEIEELVQRVQAHKSSLTLMLTILQCESMQQAETSMNHLIDLVEGLVAANIDLQNRMDAISIGQAALFSPRSSITTEQDPPSTAKSFESDLSVSRVYRKANQRDRIWSITESERASMAHSNFSDLTLSNVTIISVLNLPIWSVDLSNAAHYRFGQDGLHLTITELAERYPDIDFNLMEQDNDDDDKDDEQDDYNAVDDIDRWLTPDKHPIATTPAPASASRFGPSLAPKDRDDSIFSSAMPIEDHVPKLLHVQPSKQPKRDDPTVIYIAASLFEFNIGSHRQEAGYPYLVYKTGEMFDVIGMKGELWLARNQNDPRQTVGWIWEKHLAVLAF